MRDAREPLCTQVVECGVHEPAADVYPKNDPERAIEIDGALGDGSVTER